MNERMKRIMEFVQEDIKKNAATIGYQITDEEQRKAARELANLQPKKKPIMDLSNLMVGNE